MMIIEEEDSLSLKFDTSSSSLGLQSSDDSISSIGNTSKNETTEESFLPAGTTVTGPSICFKPHTSKITSNEAGVNGLSEGSNLQSFQENISQRLNNNSMIIQSPSDLASSTEFQQSPFPSYPAENITTVQSSTTLLHNVPMSNNPVSAPVSCSPSNNFASRQHPPIAATQNQFYSSGSTNSVFTEAETTYSPTCNVNGFKMYPCSSASSNTSSDIAMMSPFNSENPMMQNYNQMYVIGNRSPVGQQNEQSNMYSSGNYIGSPTATEHSPIPPHGEYLGEQVYHQFPAASPCLTSRGVASMPIGMENYTNNNQCIGGSSSSLPLLRDVDSPTMNDEMVQNAMRRVTHELANELKSEIREVISQVEQGMDPDGIRERSNSFNIRGNSKIDDFKGRTRSLSGEAFKSNPFRKSKVRSLLKFNDAEMEKYRREKESQAWTTCESEESDIDLEREAALDEVAEGGIESCELDNTIGNICLEKQSELSETDDSQESSSRSVGLAKWHHPTKRILKPTLKVRKTNV